MVFFLMFCSQSSPDLNAFESTKDCVVHHAIHLNLTVAEKCVVLQADVSFERECRAGGAPAGEERASARSRCATCGDLFTFDHRKLRARWKKTWQVILSGWFHICLEGHAPHTKVKKDGLVRPEGDLIFAFIALIQRESNNTGVFFIPCYSSLLLFCSVRASSVVLEVLEVLIFPFYTT